MIELGTLDQVTSVFGAKGTGKSTWALLDSREFQRRTGGYVVGHSPMGQIGNAPDVVFSRDIRQLEREMRRAPGQMHFVTTGDPESVILYGRSLAQTLKERAIKAAGHKYRSDIPPPRGVPCLPVLIVIDEGIRMRERPAHEETEDFQVFLTSARHEHVAFTFLIQAPSKRAWMIAEQSRRLILFRYLHEWGANSIRAAGIPQDVVAGLRDLPRFEFIEFDADHPYTFPRYRLPAPNAKSMRPILLS